MSLDHDKVRYTRLALQDIESLIEWLADADHEAAHEFVGKLQFRSQTRLQFTPRMGRLLGHRAVGYNPREVRQLIIDAHRVVYEIEEHAGGDETVIIVRVLHTAQDLAPVLAALK